MVRENQDAGSRNLVLPFSLSTLHRNGKWRKQRKCDGAKHCTRGFRPQKFMTMEGHRNFLSSLRRERERQKDRERGGRLQASKQLRTRPLRGVAHPPPSSSTTIFSAALALINARQSFTKWLWGHQNTTSEQNEGGGSKSNLNLRPNST